MSRDIPLPLHCACMTCYRNTFTFTYNQNPTLGSPGISPTTTPGSGIASSRRFIAELTSMKVSCRLLISLNSCNLTRQAPTAKKRRAISDTLGPHIDSALGASTNTSEQPDKFYIAEWH